MSDNTETKKKSTFFKDRIYPILFMAIITAVFIASVSGIFLATEDLVLLNETIFLKKAVLFAADIEAPEDSYELDEIFGKRVKEVTANGEELFQIVGPGGSPQGWVIYSDGPGLWGRIDAVLGFDLEGKTMTGIEFISQNETPGLGARITEPWFKAQFKGMFGPFTMAPEGTAKGDSEFDAITGATKTSTAVRQILNNGSDKAQDLIKEAK